MKTLPHLLFLLLMLLGIPVFMYFLFIKSSGSSYFNKANTDTVPTRSVSEIQIKNLEIAKLKKQNEALKQKRQSPLAQPPRPFGQAYPSSNPNSKSPLAQPPRPVGKGSGCPNSQQIGTAQNQIFAPLSE